jgi:hypothetical protein
LRRTTQTQHSGRRVWKRKIDGEYTYPAIIHDYLYWMQDHTKDYADNILKFDMLDFDIVLIVVTTVYQAVKLCGQSAWEDNANLKRKGEKKLLNYFQTIQELDGCPGRNGRMYSFKM